jgi:methyltransferase (TIGR00027 family)
MKSEVTRTAWGAAFIKSTEKFQPVDRQLFNDPLTPRFLPFSYRLILGMMKFRVIWNSMIGLIERQGKGVIGTLLCRTCYLDEVLRRSPQLGIRQVVILGAGMDSRPYREIVDKSIPFFEVDYPEIIHFKRKRVIQVLGQIPPNVIYIPIDFNTQSLQEIMSRNQYSRQGKTLFIWEGVTQYISQEAADVVFRYISNSDKGSILAFTYIVKRFIDHMDLEADKEQLDRKFREKLKKMWINGYDPDELAGYFSNMNMQLMEDIGREEYKARYLDPHQRSLSILNVERIALVRKY